MDSGSLAKRIMQYADDRTLIVQHGREAVAFAAQFSPEKYRHNIRGLFKNISYWTGCLEGSGKP
jgi:hypothetical protein